MRRPGAMIAGFGAKVAGNDQSGFFTPTDDSPFSMLNDDKPDFAVGILIPRFSGAVRGNVYALHMYVWDRGDVREVELFSPSRLGRGGMRASRLAIDICATFQAADPTSTATPG
ncbi:MAG TPA: hypothetical protein VFX70_14025 [Mycobacteriales bacterium]|nr:hypothetical protein [Mycobacteriales bacterium]